MNWLRRHAPPVLGLLVVLLLGLTIPYAAWVQSQQGPLTEKVITSSTVMAEDANEVQATCAASLLEARALIQQIKRRK